SAGDCPAERLQVSVFMAGMYPKIGTDKAPRDLSAEDAAIKVFPQINPLPTEIIHVKERNRSGIPFNAHNQLLTESFFIVAPDDCRDCTFRFFQKHYTSLFRRFNTHIIVMTLILKRSNSGR